MKQRLRLLPLLCLLALGIAAQPIAIETPGGGRMYRSSARPASQIQQQFPFDIALLRSDSTLTRSDSVLTAAAGKPSVVIFWLTTCGPCRTELNTIKANFAAWQREQPFQIVAISEEYPHRFGAFRERVMQEQWPWQAYNDVNHEFANILNGGLNGLPQVFIFDAKGALRYQTRKFTPGDELTLFEQIKLAAQ